MFDVIMRVVWYLLDWFFLGFWDLILLCGLLLVFLVFEYGF